MMRLVCLLLVSSVLMMNVECLRMREKKSAMMVARQRKVLLETRGGGISLSQEEACMITGCCNMLYSIMLLSNPSKYNSMDGARDDDETRTRLRALAAAASGVAYLLFKHENTVNVLESVLISCLGFTIVNLYRISNWPASLAAKLDLGTVILNCVVVAFALNGVIDTHLALKFICIPGILYSISLFIAPSIYLNLDKIRDDNDSRRYVRIVSTVILGLTTIAYSALDPSLAISTVALRGQFVFTISAAGIALARFFSQYRHAQTIVDVLSLSFITTIILSATPSIF
mmetsp:Transcript_17140/g.22251  ORF Transcript_17140/g.22251 Transcript_17140/m.22251 type:complete len:287 (-) Transcript_17140:23-883(-)